MLVATTIIESGIDNPHTNTLVIEDSERLGLAQLYQLKGRVGRSHVKAYAYFLFSRGKQLTEQASERLTAIAELTELGSGIKVAMRDLEIRGAGQLLGAEQHGNMSAVGFDLYAQMLREAVAEARGEPEIALPEVRVDVPVKAFLPEEYVEAADERVRFYRRLAAAGTPDGVESIVADLDRGPRRDARGGRQPCRRGARPRAGGRARRRRTSRSSATASSSSRSRSTRSSAASSPRSAPSTSSGSASCRSRCPMEKL